MIDWQMKRLIWGQMPPRDRQALRDVAAGKSIPEASALRLMETPSRIKRDTNGKYWITGVGPKVLYIIGWE
jgi:hypothetical protein